jgi:hypothetical protein
MTELTRPKPNRVKYAAMLLGAAAVAAAPLASPASGSRQLPGNVHIPSDIVTGPAVTQVPVRPIRVPSDIATAPAVSQAPA